MPTLGLTGGIGSGKSTVAGLLEARGAVVIDADALSRSVTAAGGAAIAPIASAFGTQLIAADGSLDRAHMRALVFSDPSARHRLEAIVHPLVRQATEKKLVGAFDAGARCVVLDVPLLVESPHWIRQVDRVLVVDCRTETQVARVMARNGLSEAAVRGIIDAQADRFQRRAAADAVVYNDGCTLAQLDAALERIAQYLGL